MANDLLAQLDAIGQALANTSGSLALIGLGSVGREQDRLDAYSDLDFFVVVEAGYKSGFIDDLSWLAAVSPIAYHFKNTPDGHKALLQNSVFCEFAVFELAELANIPYAAGRVVWQRPNILENLAEPQQPLPNRSVPKLDWLVGEAITNLYVGLGRYQRGEKLSAAWFVQNYAVGRVVDIASQLEPAAAGYVDPFRAERRFEQRYPNVAADLPAMLAGYDQTPAAALAILDWLEARVAVNGAMAAAIRQLAQQAE